MKKVKRKFAVSAIGLGAFFVWTVLVRSVDVAAIGPRASSVGFSRLNQWFHHFTGVHFGLYTVTDWLGLVPVFVGFAFAVFGLIQWIRRRKIWKVDFSILVLGGFYLLTLSAYLLFEEVVINYRPVLIDGFLEASYPSSTTLLVLCVMPTAALQLKGRIQNPVLRKTVVFLIAAFSVLMVVGRLLSGVHWLTDIVGGVLLSVGLVALYDGVCSFKE